LLGKNKNFFHLEKSLKLAFTEFLHMVELLEKLFTTRHCSDKRCDDERERKNEKGFTSRSM
jgi:hypothetical protein